jgi:hypothetical protein
LGESGGYADAGVDAGFAGVGNTHRENLFREEISEKDVSSNEEVASDEWLVAS